MLFRMLAAAACVTAACGALEAEPRVPTPTPAAVSLLGNGGFEDGLSGWRPVDGTSSPPSVSDEAYTGESSVELRSTGGLSAVVQSLSISEVPEYLSGFYFVDAWAPEEGQRYLGVRIRPSGGSPDPALDALVVFAGDAAGAAGQLVYLQRGDPETGEWHYVGVALRQALAARGVATPSGFASVDITLEVLTSDGEATVRFDNLYVGPQAGNPNRPDD